jgi:WD40 repeat protein/serine/threonine protein kinase
MPTSDVLQFLTNLEKSGLLPAQVLENVRASVRQSSGPITSAELARRLIADGLLTRWQAQMLLAGRHSFLLGRYRLLDHLGHGGMGSVFKAEQTTLGRVVAIKTMSEKLVSDAAAVARFRREIQAAAALNHPNIVAALDADSVGTTHFLVMEFVDGDDLGRIVQQRGPLPIALACDFIRQAALGLQHAHERGMVHRDIKPSNLLVRRDFHGLGGPPQSRANVPHSVSGSAAVVKILDMGLAKFVSDSRADGDLTSTGQIIGTPDFISPEQARSTRSADIRSDIYSLGCTLFKLLTGCVPFPGENVVERLTQRIIDDAPLVNRLRPEVPQALSAIVARMLARDPAERFQSPADVAAVLAPFATGNDGEQTMEFSPGSIADATAVTADVPAHDVPLLAAAPPNPDYERFLNLLEVETETTILETSAVAPERPAGIVASEGTGGRTHDDHSQNAAKVKSARNRKSSGGDGRALRKLEPATTRSAASPLRTRLQLRQQAEQRRLFLALGGVGGVLMLLLALVLWQRAGETTVVLQWPENERAGASLEFAGEPQAIPPQGPIRLAGKPGPCLVVLARTGFQPIRLEWELARGEVRTASVAWKPTEESLRRQALAQLSERARGIGKNADTASVAALKREIAAFRSNWTGSREAAEAAALALGLPSQFDVLEHALIPPAQRADWLPAEAVRVFGRPSPGHVGRVHRVVFSPDGKLLASCGGDSMIRLWDAVTLTPLARIEAAARSLHFSRDGRTLIVGSTGVRFYEVADLASGEYTLLEGVTGWSDCALSPDGRLLAVNVESRELQLWDIAAEPRRKLWSFAPHQGHFTVKFNRDGTLLATVAHDNTAKVWSLDGESKPALRAELPHHGWVEDAVFSPDGKTVATASYEYAIKFWDLTEEPVRPRRVVDTGQTVCSLDWTADGSRFAAGLWYGEVLVFDGGTSPPTEIARYPIHGSLVFALSFSPDGRQLASGSDDGTIQTWTLDGSSIKLRADETHGHTRAVARVAFDPAGAWIVSGDNGGDIVFWNANSGAIMHRVPADGGTVQALAVSPKSNRAAWSTSSASSGAVVWDVHQAKVTARLPELQSVTALALSPDGRLLCVGSQRVRLWNIDTAEDRTLGDDTGRIAAVAFSPDGKLVAAAGEDRRVRLWKTADGKPVAVGKTQQALTTLEFSPDGLTLVTGDAGGTVRLWNPLSGESYLLVHPGEGFETVHTAFNADGTRLVTVYRNGGVLISNPQDGRLLHSLYHPVTTTAALAPDGRHLLTGNSDSTLTLLRLPP